MLKLYEKEVLDRISNQANPLGWRPWGRNERGEARMRADIQMRGYVRVLVMTITEKGLLSHEFTIHGERSRYAVWYAECRKRGGSCECAGMERQCPIDVGLIADGRKPNA